MKKIHVIGMLLFLVLSASCGSMNKIMQVQEGMSKQEIAKIFGTPDYRRFNRGIEEWEYRTLSVVTALYKVTVIAFEDGRVSGMNTFTEEVHESPVVVPCQH